MKAKSKMSSKAIERMDRLYKRDKSSLKEIVERYYGVVDTRGVGKGVLVSMIMEAEFGRDWNK